jgi:Domain of unknown function (DUF5916)
MLLWLASALAADGSPAVLVPVRLDGEVRVDGVLDEEVWRGPAIVGFVEWSPVPGRPDRGTEAWVAYDDKFLYVAFDARVDPERRQSNALSQRDRNRAEDTVGILLDTFRDGQRAFLFMVNGRGVQGDGIYIDGQTKLGFPDLSWDTVFDAAGKFSAGRYQVEMRIPFRSLRFPSVEEQDWRIVLWQHAPVPTSDFTWPAIDPDVSGLLRQGARLAPLTFRARPSRVELLPTVTTIADVDQLPPESALDIVDAGIAARVGLSSSLTLEGTLNPDFSQIESDTGQVSANVKFPLFFPERRPFFLENVDLFSTPVRLVNTRSIVDPFGGWKMSGRAGKVALALLGAHDESPAPSTIFVDYASGEALPTWDAALVEQAQAIDHVVRVRGDLGEGSSLGVVLSDKELLVGGDDPQRLENRVAAVDGRVNVGRYTLSGQALGSETTFADGSRLLGPAWNVSASRQAERWLFNLTQFHVSRGFRAENGFLTEVGRTGGSASSQLMFRPKKVARLVSPGVDGSLSLTPERAVADANAALWLVLNPGDRWSTYTEARVLRERYLNVDFDLIYASGELAVQPTSNSYIGVKWGTGQRPHYAADTVDDLYRGFDWFVQPQINFDALGRLNFGAQAVFDVFGPDPFGEPEYITLIPRATARLTLTPRWALRGIGQYDTFSRNWEASGLVGYIVDYGTLLYFGYNELHPGDASLPPTRTVFAKIGYLARL